MSNNVNLIECNLFTIHSDHDKSESASTASSDSLSVHSFSSSEEDEHPTACLNAKQNTPNPYDPYASSQSANTEQQNQAICRICLELSGAGQEGGESLGRLISPCRCKGTMKYVHATCLDQWRAASLRTSSAVACDQCGAPYRFRKSKFVGIATSPSLLFVISLFLFLLLVWFIGCLAGLALDRYDKQDVSTRDGSSSSPTASRTDAEKSSGFWSWLTGDSYFNGWSNSMWTDTDPDYTFWSYGSFYNEPLAYVKLTKEAVRQFVSGEATEAVKDLMRSSVQSPGASQDDDQKSFWPWPKKEPIYGKGMIREGQKSVEEKDSSSTLDKVPQSRVTIKGKGERYDARLARSHRSKTHKTTKIKPKARPGWIDKLLLQFSLGFSLVGIISFVNLLLGVSFLGPFNFHNFGPGRSFARMTHNGRRGEGGGGDRGVNIASILVVILVVIGIIRALHLVFKAVRSLSRRLLSRLEEAIID